MISRAIQTALDVIYPPRCLGCGVVVDGAPGLCGTCWRETPFIGGTVCDCCGVPLPGEKGVDAVHCDQCIAAPLPWSRGRAALEYQGLARKLILGFKHSDRVELVEPAAPWLARAASGIVQNDMLVTPIPLHRFRLIRRRYNQSALLAQTFAARAGLEAALDLLERPVKTPSLEGKSRAERAETLQGAIRVAAKQVNRVRGRRVLLVDDVMTSGATFAAATRACLEVGAKEVCVLALARVVQRA